MTFLGSALKILKFLKLAFELNGLTLKSLFLFPNDENEIILRNHKFSAKFFRKERSLHCKFFQTIWRLFDRSSISLEFCKRSYCYVKK